MFTVDLSDAHIERSKLMTQECAGHTTYVVQSSLDFFAAFDTDKYGQIDLLYLDTGDMTPVEITAELHLDEARIVVERNLVKPGGLILIDDVRNLSPKAFGEAPGDTYGKAKYSIDYLLQHGFKVVKSEYQVLLRNSEQQAVAKFHAKPRKLTSSLKIFHLSYHLGCINDIKYVAHELGFEVDSEFWEGAGDGNEKYNINHNRALKYWDFLKTRALSADIVLVSDTAPLARIFLQNGFPGKLVIWICNRFDYAHAGGVQVEAEQEERYAGEHPDAFPTREYYNLIRQAAASPNVAIVSYTAFEHLYAQQYRSVEVGNEVIRPTGLSFTLSSHLMDGRGEVPSSIDKASTFLIPPYTNDERVLGKCQSLNIKCYRGRYAGPNDAYGFKGIIHVPYAWSNVALFEMISQGIPYFIPSLNLLLEEPDIFWSPPFDKENLVVAEWYDPQHSHLFVYFNSWEELPELINKTDFDEKRRVLSQYGVKHRDDTLRKWRSLLYKL